MFIALNDSLGGDVWTCYVAHNNANMYDIIPTPPGRESTMIRDGRRLRVECVDSVDVIFHGYMDGATPYSVYPMVPV